jgi:hypothetical protein
VQLCALDVSKFVDVLALIIMCRRITRHVRKTSNGFVTIWAEQNLSLPKIDGVTRWLSTYYMLESILRLKDILPEKIEYVSTVRDDVSGLYKLMNVTAGLPWEIAGILAVTSGRSYQVSG